MLSRWDNRNSSEEIGWKREWLGERIEWTFLFIKEVLDKMSDF